MIGVNYIILTPKTTMSTILIFIASILIVISLLLIKGYIKMNYLIGVRYPEAFYTDENWYKINAYGGKVFLIWAILIVMAAILLFLLPVDNSIILIAYIIVFATIIIPIAITHAYVKNLNDRQKCNIIKTNQ